MERVRGKNASRLNKLVFSLRPEVPPPQSAMPLEKIVLSGGRFPLVKPPRVALKRPRSRS
jgi:hypothetical protein